MIPGPGDLRHYPAYNLIAWHPSGVMDDLLLDAIGEWLARVEKATPKFHRFIDFSQLTEVAVRVHHVFEFARKRARQLAEAPPMKSALFCEDWVGFGVARMYQDLMAETPLEVRAFRERARAAAWLGVPIGILTLEDRSAGPE
jgi:hypothetical protein